MEAGSELAAILRDGRTQARAASSGLGLEMLVMAPCVPVPRPCHTSTASLALALTAVRGDDHDYASAMDRGFGDRAAVDLAVAGACGRLSVRAGNADGREADAGRQARAHARSAARRPRHHRPVVQE